ncbi:HAMP domain-containing histidine kinase [Alkalihalobacillus oceani]|uniref:HAMP domain-containing sensor histidine kinase n=1 Tax=Halalkalibacter oceani TaxID=1653776 RepID=UPI0020416311|nr:HAMP domain-containing sensor histidine kinase [Halalkalibacter oceani]MCM3761925.1 HAMP domain-containing histidine kinase [Halalkalibacter oceani]
MNLRGKLWLLLLSSSLTSLLLLIGIAAVIGWLFNQGYTHQNLNTLGQELARQAQQSEAESGQTADLLEDFQRDHPVIELAWLGADGQLRYATNGRTFDYDINEVMNLFLNMPQYLWEEGEQITLLFDWQTGEEQQFLIMSLPNDAMQGSQIFVYIQDYAQFGQLLLPLALFILTPYVFALIFFLRLNRRLTALNHAMKTFDANDTSLLIETESSDEIGQLTRSFNEMANRIRANVARINELDAKRKSLIADISHDLRTPLTMIIGYAESLDKHLLKNPAEQQKYMTNLLRRAQYMDDLLQKLLEIAQIDKYKQHIRFVRQDLGETIRLIAASYIPIVEAKGIEVDIHIPEEPLYLAYDASLLERAARNLIENAIQYGGDGRYLGIFLRQEEEHVTITVADHGPGIDAEKQKLIFERFYRGAKGRGGEGFGLGLAIVQEVANAHNGYVRITSQPQEETMFTLFLPKNNCSS